MQGPRGYGAPSAPCMGPADGKFSVLLLPDVPLGPARGVCITHRASPGASSGAWAPAWPCPGARAVQSTRWAGGELLCSSTELWGSVFHGHLELRRCLPHTQLHTPQGWGAASESSSQGSPRGSVPASAWAPLPRTPWKWGTASQVLQDLPATNACKANTLLVRTHRPQVFLATLGRSLRE